MRSRADRIALAVGVLVLAVGPLLVTLLRSEDYSSSTTVRMSANPSGDLLPRPLEFVAGPLKVNALQRAVARDVDWLDSPRDLPDYVTVRSTSGPGRPRYVLTARGPSADGAHQLATVSAREVARAAENGARFFLGGELDQLRRELRRDDLDPARRRELAARREQAAAVMSGSQTAFEQSSPPATRADERLADRVLGAMPGSRPLRPNPIWAGLAGLTLAVALLAWVLALGPRRGSGASSAQL
jgi:hypothetical protein